jgi:transcriptional regulator with XRE-family HTH domain
MSMLLEAVRTAVKSHHEHPAAIAKGAGIARSQLSRLLNGHRGLSIESVEKLAAYLQLRIIVRPMRRERK